MCTVVIFDDPESRRNGSGWANDAGGVSSSSSSRSTHFHMLVVVLTVLDGLFRVGAAGFLRFTFPSLPL
ncbi:hypothetical protein Aduo_019204 [Ancylostoma duodenale]